MTAKWPKAAKLLYVELYKAPVYLVTDRKTADEVIAFFAAEDKSFDGLFGSCITATSRDGNVVNVVVVLDNDPSTLVHECGHCAFAILEPRGVPVSRGSDEAYCYLLGYLFDKLSEMMVKPKRGKR